MHFSKPYELGLKRTISTDEWSGLLHFKSEFGLNCTKKKTQKKLIFKISNYMKNGVLIKQKEECKFKYLNKNNLRYFF